jgi:hypothetical protein
MTTTVDVSGELATKRFCRTPDIAMRDLLGEPSLASWPAFASSWDALELDQHMADGGRYRRRRYGCFESRGHGQVRLPHQPHYQSTDYNRLNGGIERWFAVVDDAVAGNPVLTRLLDVCHTSFAAAAGLTAADARWRVEMHQFRIEADARTVGQPTPEGTHRDGVDWVLVMLVARENVAGGVTAITDAQGRPLGEFALERPLDSVWLDDHEVWHGVTPLTPHDPGRLAHRDVLVLTFRDARVR